MRSLLVLLVACHGKPGAPVVESRVPPPSPPKPTPAVVKAGPGTGESCLAKAREGQLVASLVGDIGAFHVTVGSSPDHVYVGRRGRALSKSEGEQLVGAFSSPGPRGVVSGHPAEKQCPGVGDASCWRFEMRVCQGELAGLTTYLADAAKRAGLDDAELGASVQVLEANGPRCKTGCVPEAHASVRSATYAPNAGRTPIREVNATHAQGACRHDGDCDVDGNRCRTWYLRGGQDLAVYLKFVKPTFCGCVEHACGWFTQ